MTAEPRSPDLTASVEDHLKAIYHLEQSGGAASTADVAQRVGVAPPSVSGMVRRLAEQGLVSYERYHGALDTLGVDERARVARVCERDPAVLRYLDELGIRPGAAVQLIACAPFGGPITVDVSGVTRVIGPGLAAEIMIAAA